jgi:hypothetical protein
VDCSARAASPSLHVALAARGLAEAAEDDAPPVDLGDGAPDPRYAVSLDASPGLLAAAARTEASIERIENGLRVLAATVSIASGGGLACDCPMRDAPACLHASPRLGPRQAPRRQTAPRRGRPAPVAASGPRPRARQLRQGHGSLIHLDARDASSRARQLRPAARVWDTLERVDAWHRPRALGVRDGAAPRRPAARPRARRRAGLGEIQAASSGHRPIAPRDRICATRPRANTGARSLSDFASARSSASRSHDRHGPRFEA